MRLILVAAVCAYVYRRTRSPRLALLAGLAAASVLWPFIWSWHGYW